MINARHQKLLINSLSHLKLGREKMNANESEEFVLQELTTCRNFIDEIIGLKSNEDILDKLFNEFLYREIIVSLSLRTDPDQPYDVIVCGAGHAGCEAALAATRIGAEVLMLTGNLDTIAQMSCNPAIGGQAKGQIVREVDALGGEMGLNTDFTAIQFKLLNTSKGPSVQAPQAQCDKKAYQARMKHVLEQNQNLCIFQALVNGLVIEDGVCKGIKTSLDLTFYGKSVVVTTGTFLRALMHVGQNQSEGGRLGDHVAKGLSADFLNNGIELGRFKTELHRDFWVIQLTLIKLNFRKVIKFLQNLLFTIHAQMRRRSTGTQFKMVPHETSFLFPTQNRSIAV